MASVPILHTERLVLRAHRPDDLDAYTALWSDPAVVRFTSGQPLDRQECWARILRFRGMWEVVGVGFMIVEERQTGRLIGEAGIMDKKRVIDPPLDGTIEAGWAFLPDAQGKGLATEAMRTLLDWADSHHPGVPQSCIITEGNEPSMRLAARLGFHETARSPYAGKAVVHYRRDAAAAPA
jgi:RimJ/RimL family protein N-acetyltransferase